MQCGRHGLRCRPSLVQRVCLIAALSLIAAVALALKLCLKTRLLFLAERSGDGPVAALPDDAVGEGVQMQVNIAVWVFAQTAAVRSTQGLAA